MHQGYSIEQGATSFILTAVKDIAVYKASAYVAPAVGAFVGAKFGATLGVFAGPVGVIVGAVVGFAVGYFINKVGDTVIEWVMGLF